jgi:hypothetical protein
MSKKKVLKNEAECVRLRKFMISTFLIGLISFFTFYTQYIMFLQPTNTVYRILDYLFWVCFIFYWIYTDRRWHEPFPLAFYLNALSTEFLDFRGLRQSRRTLEFLWAKRHELTTRVTGRVFRSRLQKGGFASRHWVRAVQRRSGVPE